MRQRFFSLYLLALILVPVMLAAAGLSAKYRSWDTSPEAYFLTSDERSQWKQVRTDDEAEKFIAAYYARRSPDLPAVLKERIAVADKYFSAGKVKGSETLRGKVIILFGPPTKVDLSKPRVGGRVLGDSGDVSYAGSGVDDPLTNVGPGSSGVSGIRASAEQEQIFSVIYDEKAAPKAIGKAFRVGVRMKSGDRQEAADPQDLEAKFETLAKASIVK